LPGNTAPSLVHVGCEGAQAAGRNMIAWIKNAVPRAVGRGDRELDCAQDNFAKEKDEN